MLPRDTTEQAFTLEQASSCLVTDDGVRLWRVLFKGEFVGYTRRPAAEIDELNEKHRIAQQKRRTSQ